MAMIALVANSTAGLAPRIGGVGLSGSGFLIFFLLGVLEMLEQRGAIVRSAVGGGGGGGSGRAPATARPIGEHTVFAGSSGGAILSVVSCLGVPYTAVSREADGLADRCAARNNCALTLGAELRRTLTNALAAVQPSLGEGGVAAAVERCRGRAFVNLSVFGPEKKRELYADAEGYSGVARRSDRRRRGGSRNRRNDEKDDNDNGNDNGNGNRDALSEIGLEYRPGNVLCAAMGVSVAAQLALMGATQLLPPGLGLHPRPWLVSDWRSAEDAIDGAAASSFNALLSALSPTTTFRGVPLVADGVYTVPLPVPPPEAVQAGSAVRISSVPDGYAMAPGSPEIRGADIWPGARTGGDLAGLATVEEWLCHALVVPDAALRRAMVELGRREAALFLDERR